MMEAEYINEWVDWMIRNPELAEKNYPELMQGLIAEIRNSEPFLTALIIQKIPENFPKWKTEIEGLFGITKQKTIQRYINFISDILSKYEYQTEIEKEAVESVREELTEQREYWIKELKYISQPTKFTGFQTTLHPDKLKPLFTRLIETGYIAPGTDFKSFAACFNGLPLPDTFALVQWIKRNKKNKLAAKKALTDLLILIGTPKEQYRDISKLKTFFVDYTGNPLIFTQSNFDNSKDFKDNSEYFPELQNIINSL